MLLFYNADLHTWSVTQTATTPRAGGGVRTTVPTTNTVLSGRIRLERAGGNGIQGKGGIG